MDGVSSTPVTTLGLNATTDPNEPEDPTLDPIAGEGTVPPEPSDGEGETVTDPFEAGEGEDTEETPDEGVLRLLLEGHFKGVADVRLRINFHEQLAELQGETTRIAAGEALDGLSNTVNTQIDEFVAAGELSEEQAAGIAEAQASFNEAVAAAGEAMSDPEAVPDESAADPITEAFEELADTLESVLVPEGDPPPPAEYETFLSELREAFAGGLAALLDALRNVSILPELSPPSGNGVAYEKFLAIYDELQGSTQTSEPEPPVDLNV